MHILHRFNWKRWLLVFFIIMIVAANAVGLYFGNLIYQETSTLYSHLNDQRLQDFKQIAETKKQDEHWENIIIESQFGYPLSGTYIPNPQPSNQTLIFLHGFTENRSFGLNYLDIYRNAGFNVLLIDSRAHGDSGGSSVTWGNYEKYDVEQWVNWVAQKHPTGVIGIHGVSMGASIALLHAELNEKSKRVAFYIADSAYSDFETLLELQTQRYFPNISVPKILLQYANVAAYINARFTFYQASPIHSVRNVTTPILYMHGEDDRIIPAYMSQELYQATKGPRQLYIFPKAAHIAAIYDDRYKYSGIIQNFVDLIEHHQS